MITLLLPNPVLFVSREWLRLSYPELSPEEKRVCDVWWLCTVSLLAKRFPSFSLLSTLSPALSVLVRPLPQVDIGRTTLRLLRNLQRFFQPGNFTSALIKEQDKFLCFGFIYGSETSCSYAQQVGNVINKNVIYINAPIRRARSSFFLLFKFVHVISEKLQNRRSI